MAKQNDSELMQVLAGVIRGVIDGDISPAQANAVSATTSQMIKLARLKIESGETMIDGVSVPKKNLLTSDVVGVRKEVFDYISENGAATMKQIGTKIGIGLDAVKVAVEHDWFAIKGNIVSIAN